MGNSIRPSLTCSQLDELYGRLYRQYLRRIIELLHGRRSLNVASGKLVIRVVRRDLADFHRRCRIDTGRYAEDVMVERLYCHDGISLRLDCSATNYNLDEGGTFHGDDIRRLWGIKHAYTLHPERYKKAPHVTVRSLYLLVRLVERILRLRSGRPEPDDLLPFELVELSDRGYERDEQLLAEELFGGAAAEQ